MEPVQTSFKCLQINTNGTLNVTWISENELDNAETTFERLRKTMRSRGYPVYFSRIARAAYPEEAYYYAFVENDADRTLTINPIATLICSNTYNSNPKHTNDKNQAYGNCFIALIDSNGNLCDCDPNTFVIHYNKVYLPDGREDRLYNNRLYKIGNDPQCYTEKEFSSLSRETIKTKLMYGTRKFDKNAVNVKAYVPSYL